MRTAIGFYHMINGMMHHQLRASKFIQEERLSLLNCGGFVLNYLEANDFDCFSIVLSKASVLPWIGEVEHVLVGAIPPSFSGTLLLASVGIKLQVLNTIFKKKSAYRKISIR